MEERIISVALHPDTSSVDATLNDRHTKYGTFKDLAGISQSLKRVATTGNLSRMDDDMVEALDLILTKIARILTGNPHHADSWHDIAGYAKLVEDRLNGKVR